MTHFQDSTTKDLTFLCLNAENLFILAEEPLTDKHTKMTEHEWGNLSLAVFENKPLRKIKGLVSVINECNPDIILLSEVGGQESLENFNRLFLQEQYFCALIEGNSDRHIDVGFLIKKNINCFFDIHTNKNKPIHFLYPHEKQIIDQGQLLIKNGKSITSHRFSRDVAELHLFIQDRNHPCFIALLTHLKSLRDPDGIDPGGTLRRTKECEALVEIYNELHKKHPNTPILVAGDFNGSANKNNTDPEFKSIYEKTDLIDVCELANLPISDRATYFQIDRAQRVDARQIDYCFLSNAAQKFLDTSTVLVHPYKDDLGTPLGVPHSLEAKFQFPSDHRPIIFTLKAVPIK